MLGAVFVIYTGIIVAIAGEGAIANAISNAGLPGIIGALLMVAFPGSLVLYLLGQLTNQ